MYRVDRNMRLTSTFIIFPHYFKVFFLSALNQLNVDRVYYLFILFLILRAYVILSFFWTQIPTS